MPGQGSNCHWLLSPMTKKPLPRQDVDQLEVLSFNSAATISLCSLGGFVEQAINLIADGRNRLGCGHHLFALNVCSYFAGDNQNFSLLCHVKKTSIKKPKVQNSRLTPLSRQTNYSLYVGKPRLLQQKNAYKCKFFNREVISATSGF